MFNLFNKKKEVILKVEEPKKEPFDIIANPSPRRSEVIDLGDGRKVTVWDDFLIDLWFDELFKHITHAQIPWYLNNNVSVMMMGCINLYILLHWKSMGFKGHNASRHNSSNYS